MAKIQNEIAYKAAMERIEELLPLVDDDTPLTDRNLIELDLLAELVADYEDEHYPIKAPSLVDVMKLRMYEMGINQAKLSELLGVFYSIPLKQNAPVFQAISGSAASGANSPNTEEPEPLMEA